MNKFCWTFSLTLCMLTNALLAQSDFNLTMKGGLLLGDEKVAYNNNSFNRNTSSLRKSGSLSVAFSVPLKKSFRLGAEIGVNNFQTLLDYEFNFSPTFKSTYIGDYRINQAYFAVVPEYRLAEYLYVNAGVGYFTELTSQFIDGSRLNLTSTSFEIEDIAGWDYKRSNTVGYFFSLGLCPNITKNLALLVEARYTNSPVKTNSSDIIGISYHAFIANFGLMFKLQS